MTSYRVSLDSARAKWDQAKVHRDGLDHQIRTVFDIEANSIVVGAEKDPETGYHVYKVETLPDLDPIMQDVGLRVG